MRRLDPVARQSFECSSICDVASPRRNAGAGERCDRDQRDGGSAKCRFLGTSQPSSAKHGKAMCCCYHERKANDHIEFVGIP